MQDGIAITVKIGIGVARVGWVRAIGVFVSIRNAVVISILGPGIGPGPELIHGGQQVIVGIGFGVGRIGWIQPVHNLPVVVQIITVRIKWGVLAVE